MKLPVPVPLLVLVANAVVGFVVVDQHTPRAVTATPPSAVTLPPLVAPVEVMADAAVVVETVGAAFTLTVTSVALTLSAKEYGLPPTVTAFVVPPPTNCHVPAFRPLLAVMIE